MLRDDPSCSRSASTPSGSTCRWRSCSALARTTTVAQLLERDDFAKRCAARGADLDPRAALPAACRATTRSPCAPTSSSAAPTRRSTCCSARDIQRAYGQPEQVVLTMPILPGRRRRARRCRSRWATTSASPRRRTRCTGSTLSLPDEAMDTWFDAAARSSARRRARRPRDAKRALARALVARFHGAEAAAAAAAQFDRVLVAARGARGDRGARGRGRQRRRSTCRRLIADGFGDVALGRAAHARPGRRQARRRAAGGRGPRRAARAPRRRVLQVGKRHFRRLRVS